MLVWIDLEQLDIAMDKWRVDDYRHLHVFEPETIIDVAAVVECLPLNVVTENFRWLNVVDADDDMGQSVLHLLDDENSPFHKIDCVYPVQLTQQ